MSVDRRRVEEICEAALECPPEGRDAFLNDACGSDAALRGEVDALLKYAPAASAFLDTPLHAVAAGVIEALAALNPGVRLGPYEIGAPLGAGGMGVVYSARDTRLGRDVAVKLLPGIADGDPDARARLMREARTAASLNHPHICTVHDVGGQDGVPFIAMELVDGESLQHAVRRGRFSPERACRIGRQLAEALEYAHAHNVVHRDFKSANVILTPSGQAKVLDFGLAVRSVAPTDQTHIVTFEDTAHRMAGTLSYMAPEVLQGSAATVRSDIWALGVVLYEMVAGRAPFERKTDSDLVAAILRDTPGPLPSGTPPGLARIIERCLAKEPSDRPGRAGEVALALDVAEPRASSGEIAAEGTAPAPNRSFRAVAIAAAVLVAAGAAIYVVVGRRASSGASTIRFGNPTQITTAVGVEEFPAWSPDGRMLAYAADPSGNPDSPTWDIWVVQPGGGAPINRTADYPGQDLFPSWSPDGSHIAFWSDRDGGGCYVMPALAGTARRIADASRFDPNPPQWSADGSEIGCVNGDLSVVKMDIVSVQTGQVVRQIDLVLPGESRRRSFVTWSRSGHDIAFVESTAGLGSDVSRLWVLHLPLKKSMPLTDGRTKAMSPNWSPDGRTLYYVANSGATMDLWAQNIDDDGTPVGAARTLTAGLGIRNAAFSVDGRSLAYSQGRKVANVWRVPLRSDAPATWADATQLTLDQAFIECADVNRSGTQLVLSSDRAGSFDLWTLPAAGGEMHQLTTDPSAEWCPNWSPDGSTVAFYAYRTGNREVWTVPAAGGAWRQITDNPGVDMHPGWSADGKELLFLSDRDGWTGSWATPVAGGQGRRLVDSNGARWSPVDRRIAYFERGRLWVAADDGRGPKVQLAASSVGGRVSWTPDGAEVIFRGGRDRSGIYVVKADGTGRERLLMDVSGRRGAVGLYGTPTDGKYIYFTWDEDLGDLWVMSADSSR